jgi:hypothetical protein
MSDDFYDRSARQRYQVLQAAKARLIADLEEFKAADDEHSAQVAIQELAGVNDQMVSLERLHTEYHQRLNPPPPPPETEAEWQAKPADKMTEADALQIYAKSKYFPQNPGNDADFLNRYHRGRAEVARLRKESGR